MPTTHICELTALSIIHGFTFATNFFFVYSDYKKKRVLGGDIVQLFSVLMPSYKECPNSALLLWIMLRHRAMTGAVSSTQRRLLSSSWFVDNYRHCEFLYAWTLRRLQKFKILDNLGSNFLLAAIAAFCLIVNYIEWLFSSWCGNTVKV